MNKQLICDIRAALPGLQLKENEPMSRYCSFRIGGPAAALAEPSSPEELAALARLLRAAGEKPFLMGNGTNLLIGDGPFDRFVIRCGDNLSALRAEGDRIHAQCGATLARTAALALEEGLGGMEFAAGIPGSIGGAVSMNAGAYGGEMKDIVESTDYLDEDLNFRTLQGEEHSFGYRHSRFSDTDCVILSATLRLQSADREQIGARMKELAAKRRASQPLELPSAGSTFKRPAGGFAAALIDQAGLKGYAVGGAQVSPKHAGFVVNTGGATCEDVLRLMEHIQKVVYESSGIVLEPEVKILR